MTVTSVPTAVPPGDPPRREPGSRQLLLFLYPRHLESVVTASSPARNWNGRPAGDQLDEPAQRAVALGAGVADPPPDSRWRVLLDPAGHLFCITTLAPRPETLARISPLGDREPDARRSHRVGHHCSRSGPAFGRVTPWQTRWCS